jgi:hypothetical protein
MAKKKKQKKAGLAKRQKSKLQKKTAAKRKVQALKTPQRRVSPGKVKQNLKNLPSLVFEPELESIAFTADEVNQAIAEHDKTPDQVEAIATPEYMDKLLEKLQEMRTRFEIESDANKSMMVHAILYFMEQEEAPAYLNQIIVAMFFRIFTKIQEPEHEIDLKELNQKLKEYDETWTDYLQEKMEAAGLTDMAQGGYPLPSEDADDAEEELSPLLASPFESLVAEFSDYLGSELSLDEEARERAIEDVEVLMNDYCEEKEITDIDDLKARKIRNFLEGWFVRMMNPTKEDMETMINSLDYFFQFAASKEKLPLETTEGVKKLFEDRSALLSSFDA